MSLSDIVNVVITKGSASVSRAGFGTPLLLSNEAKTKFDFAGGELYRLYTSAADMVVDGFSSTGAAVAAVTSLFSQSPKPRRVMVGARSSLETKVVELTIPNAGVRNSTVYTVTLNGTAFTVTSDPSATRKEIVDALTVAINLGSVPVTASDDDVTLTLTADVAGAIFTLEVNDRELLHQYNATTDAGIVADLTAIQAKAGGDDWYWILVDNKSKTVIKLLAAAIESMSKVFGYATADDAVPAGTAANVALDLEASAYARTFGIYHPTEHEFAEAAWIGRVAPLDPGSYTLKFKTLAGVPVYSLSTTERTNILNASCGIYETVGGINMTSEGETASGEFVDTTVFIDFVSARLKENVFFRLVNANKIPFTDAGIAIIENEVRGVMELGIKLGGFTADPAPVVTVPLAADVDANDRAARTLPDVTFTATLAGAVHSLTINGTVTV